MTLRIEKFLRHRPKVYFHIVYLDGDESPDTVNNALDHNIAHISYNGIGKGTPTTTAEQLWSKIVTTNNKLPGYMQEDHTPEHSQN